MLDESRVMQMQELGLRLEALGQVAQAIADDDHPLGLALAHLVARVEEAYRDVEPPMHAHGTGESLSCLELED